MTFKEVSLYIMAILYIAAWGIIALLIAVFPANIYHFTSKGKTLPAPTWFLYLRLPLQIVLMYWAYLYI